MINDDEGKKVLADFLDLVAVHLPGWKVNRIANVCGVYLQFDAGRRFYFFFSRGMVVADASFPDGHTPRYWGIKDEIEKFRFNLSRKPAHIANKLKALFPQYFAIYEQCRLALVARKEMAERQRQYVEMIARQFDFVRVSKSSEEYRLHSYFGTVTVHRNMEVSFDMHYMPLDAVFPLLGALQNAKK